MGCRSSTTAISHTTDFSVIVHQVKQTWPTVQKIHNLGAKTFAHLLHHYPETRTFYHIPEAYKTEADLLNADEVKEPGEEFISFYSNLIEYSDTKFAEILQEKAIDFYTKGVPASQVKWYGESLIHVINYELNNELISDEKKSWQLFTNQVSNDITIELSKLPRRSIIDKIH